MSSWIHECKHCKKITLKLFMIKQLKIKNKQKFKKSLIKMTHYSQKKQHRLTAGISTTTIKKESRRLQNDIAKMLDKIIILIMMMKITCQHGILYMVTFFSKINTKLKHVWTKAEITQFKKKKNQKLQKKSRQIFKHISVSHRNSS